MKVGVIRCMQTRDYCASGRDFRTILGHKDAFADVDEDIEITGFVDCGGCPGKKAVLRARLLVARDVGDNIRIIDYTHEAAPEQ